MKVRGERRRAEACMEGSRKLISMREKLKEKRVHRGVGSGISALKCGDGGGEFPQVLVSFTLPLAAC